MKLILALFAVLGAASAVGAELELASPFSDHMVLQRDRPISVWGWGKPGKLVQVVLADQSATTEVSNSGKWSLQLDPLPAGGPHQMTAACEGEVVECRDVLIGEVWICSGQSNMVQGWNKSPDIAAMAEESKSHPIRSFAVQTNGAFAPLDRCGGTWEIGPSGSAVACAFALELQKGLGVPVGVIVTAWGSSSLEGWMPIEMTSLLPHFDEMMAEFEVEDRERVAGILKRSRSIEGRKRWGEDEVYLRTRPNLLFNAMMHPLIPYTVRGIVWYQGEANTRSLEAMLQYGTSLPMWVTTLREKWQQEDLEFLAVMLPRYGRVVSGSPSGEVDDPKAWSWAWMRESQQSILALDHTGIATTIDLGDVENIHPTDKRPIGERLALLARRDMEQDGFTAEGPVFCAAEPLGNSIRVTFRNAEGLQTIDGKSPRAFWVSGDGIEWGIAGATIRGGEIVLRSNEIKKPRFVRYAFSGFPDVNLVNGAGLPARPFRTDDASP